MKLKQWLAENSVSLSDFAKSTGASAMSIARYSKGEDVPGLELALTICKCSGGEVFPSDLLIDKKRRYSEPGDPVIELIPLSAATEGLM